MVDLQLVQVVVYQVDKYISGISYCQVCGKVIGYQFGTPNGSNNNDYGINEIYIDGISLTRGNFCSHI